jgi:hypothetical protein
MATEVCHACVTAVTVLNTFTDVESEQWNEIRETMYQQCGGIPAGMARDNCNGFVFRVNALVTPILAGDLKPLKTCVDLGVCSHAGGNAASTVLSEFTGQSNLGSVIERLCHQCDAVSDQVKAVLLNFIGQWGAVREQLVEQCKAQATPELQAACQQGIEVVDGIIASAKDAITNTDVCSMAGCPAESSFAKSVLALVAPQTPTLRGTGALDGMCDMCTTFTSLLEARFDSFVEQFTFAFKRACASKGNPDGCEAAVEQITAIFDQMREAIKDNKLCFMCRDSPADNFATIGLMKLGSKNGEGGICGACETASDSVKAQVRDFVEQYHVVSKTLAAKCEECPEADVQDMCKQGLAQLDAAVEQVRAAVADSDVCSLVGCEAAGLALPTTPAVSSAVE